MLVKVVVPVTGPPGGSDISPMEPLLVQTMSVVPTHVWARAPGAAPRKPIAISVM
jgi:hypothetical protein